MVNRRRFFFVTAGDDALNPFRFFFGGGDGDTRRRSDVLRNGERDLDLVRVRRRDLGLGLGERGGGDRDRYLTPVGNPRFLLMRYLTSYLGRSSLRGGL